jgi:subtilase family serine protease
MHTKKKFFRRVGSLVTCMLMLTVIAGYAVLLTSKATAAPKSQVASARMQDGFIAHTVKIKPVTKQLGNVQSLKLKTPLVSGTNKVLFPCQSSTNPLPITCYGPGQIAQAYGLQGLAQRGITGKGSTIVIIDAFGSPTIQADLQAFDVAWGLPDPQLTVLAPYGVNGSNYGWAGETSLDVEYSHAMAPGAAITLVAAQSDSDVDLYNAIKYAVDQNLGDVISMSFGETESCADPNLLAAEHQVFQEAASKGVSVLASAGDFGSAQFTCDGSSFTTAVSEPASDPLVTALGGTALTADTTTGQYIGETAWNESGDFGVAGGGGYSLLNQRPDYQSGVTGNTAGRAVPDLALNSSVIGGVLVFMTDPFSGQEYATIYGGTSVASPEFAGIVADGVQMAHHRLGLLNRGLYTLGKSPLSSAAFHDITSGNNVLFSSGIAGYTVQQGWDAVTGWGTPKADVFLPMLIASLHSNDAHNL